MSISIPEHWNRAALAFAWARQTRCADNWLTADQENERRASNRRAGSGLVESERSRIIEHCRSSDTELIFHDDAEWPAMMNSMPEMPGLLFARGITGENRHQPAAAIVGARNANEQALSEAHRLAFGLAAEEITVVSGLAAGIDTQGHTGALAANGYTIGVIGTGIDECFPPQNQALKKQIENSGTLFSQFPLGQRGSKTSFLTRNAVIAALSEVSIAVYCEERSGTRSELRHALSMNRPVVLWAPTMEHQQWARDWAASNSLVWFASDIGQIIQTAQSLFETANADSGSRH